MSAELKRTEQEAPCERKHGAICGQRKTDLADEKHSSVKLFICESFILMHDGYRILTTNA